jgi:hypothetical protein
MMRLIGYDEARARRCTVHHAGCDCQRWALALCLKRLRFGTDVLDQDTDYRDGLLMLGLRPEALEGVWQPE